MLRRYYLVDDPVVVNSNQYQSKLLEEIPEGYSPTYINTPVGKDISVEVRVNVGSLTDGIAYSYYPEPINGMFPSDTAFINLKFQNPTKYSHSGTFKLYINKNTTDMYLEADATTGTILFPATAGAEVVVNFEVLLSRYLAFDEDYLGFKIIYTPTELGGNSCEIDLLVNSIDTYIDVPIPTPMGGSGKAIKIQPIDGQVVEIQRSTSLDTGWENVALGDDSRYTETDVVFETQTYYYRSRYCYPHGSCSAWSTPYEINHAGSIPIANASDFQAINNTTTHTFASGTEYEVVSAGGLDKDYILVGDVDLSSVPNWSPIGSLTTPFTGTIDFNNKSILNLNIDSQVDYLGLFSAIENASVRNLKSIDGNIVSSSNNVGAITGIAINTVFQKCISSVSVSGAGRVGSFIGEIQNCSVRECSSINNTIDINEQIPLNTIGGFIGLANDFSSIENSFCATSINVNSSDSISKIGGFIGELNASSTTTNCYTANTFSVKTTLDIINLGGFCGLLGTNSETLYCYYDSDVSGELDTGKGEPRTTDDMTYPYNQQNTYTLWDFGSIWNIQVNINNGYPFLRWSPMQEGSDEIIPIADKYDLEAMKFNETHTFASGTPHELTTIGGMDKKYIQVADILFDGIETFNRIGTNESKFTGEFDGQGFTISNLRMDIYDWYNGLFGYTDTAKLSNINLKNVTFINFETDYIGGIVGYALFTDVINCSVDNINIDFNDISNYSYTFSTGGMIGYLEDGSCVDSSVTNATIVGGDSVGLLAGHVERVNVTNCIASGDVKAYSGRTGGLIGASYGGCTIENCGAFANVIHETYDYSVGGFIGAILQGDVVRKCFAIGTTSGGYISGGFLGRNHGVCEDCFAIVDVEISSSSEGYYGLGGFVAFAYENAQFLNCYSAGKVTGGFSEVGGFVGDFHTSVIFDNCYYDYDIANISDSSNAQPRSTGDMTHPYNETNTYIDWDFLNIWSISEHSNYGYPSLKWYISGGAFAGGTGTTYDPYLVSTPEELNAVRFYLHAHFLQINDIDMSNWGNFDPIGESGDWYSIAESDTPFEGSYNGDNYEIQNLQINITTARHCIGLFAYVNQGELKNIKLTDPIVNTPKLGFQVSNLGILAGRVHNEYNEVPGVPKVFYDSGNVTNCRVINGVLNGDSYYVGGLIGRAHNYNISNCTFSGEITSYGKQIGGLIGEALGRTLSKCLFEGYINLDYLNNQSDLVGGLIGWCGYHYISECGAFAYFNSINDDNTLKSTKIGGLFGSIRTVDAVGDGNESDYETTVYNAYSTGTVNVYNANVAGFIYSSEENFTATVTKPVYLNNCYTSMNIISDVVLTSSSEFWHIENDGCYFVPQRCYYNYYYNEDLNLHLGYPSAIDAGVEPRSYVEMQDKDSYEYYDFDSIWNINNIFNKGFPYFKWQKFEIIPVTSYEDLLAISSTSEHTFGANTQYVKTTRGGLNKIYRQMNAIDLSTKVWEPIGDSSQPFTGVYDGNGRGIYNMKIENSIMNQGFFGALSDATVADTYLNDVDISINADNVGALCGVILYASDINNCVCTGVVKGNSQVGALIGLSNDAMVQNSKSDASVIGVINVGGLIGKSQNNIYVFNSYSTGNINDNGVSENIGGLIGFAQNKSTINDCNSIGTIIGTKVGGLVGLANDINIVDSYSFGDIVNQNNNDIGGIVGRIDSNTLANITLSFSKGAIYGNDNVGGIVGYAENLEVYRCTIYGDINGNNNIGGISGNVINSKIEETFSTGKIRGQSFVGGLLGYAQSTEVVNCFSVGSTVGDNTIGGLIGSIISNSIVTNTYSANLVIGNLNFGGLIGVSGTTTITSSYWNVDTSEVSVSDGGESKTNDEMKQEATFTSWNFVEVWFIDEGDDYPKLLWYQAPKSMMPFMVDPDGATTMGGNSKLTMDSMGNLNPNFRGVYIPSQIETDSPWDGIINRGGWRSLASRWKFNHETYMLQNDDNFTLYFKDQSGKFNIDNEGNTTVYKDIIVEGNKNCIVNTESYGKRVMYALESPDSRFMIHLEKQLPLGTHEIKIPESFLETITEYFIIPNPTNASSVSVLARKDTSFIVSVDGHRAEVIFKIVGRRKGYEDLYMEEFIEPKE